MSEGPGRSIAIALSLVVALVVGIGLYVSGSPATARQEMLDGRRVRDLRDAKTEIYSYWHRYHALPAAIDSISPVPADSAGHRDPVTGTPYEYRVTSDSTYELCAVFALPSPAEADVDWRHPAGRHCFPVTLKEPLLSF